MKLHRMEITAFGPFPGHESIDFDALNDAGVFLLNGETGSGKTSVLDAICFALYGSGPTTAAKGGRKAQHSDHADPQTGPRVDVEFTAGGRRWHVSRTPAWRAPSKRAASGWTERHATVLLREFVSGEWVERGYRPDDVGQMIHHAVGLDREQFTQVMMLPQGQFARFLQAGSREREELLETLFGTDVYAGIQDELKVRADEARTELRSAEADVERGVQLLERYRGRVSAALAELPSELRLEVADVPVAEESAPLDRDVARRGWGAVVARCGALVDAVDRARREAADRCAEAAARHARREGLQALLHRQTELTGRLDVLTGDSERAEAAARRVREHALAQQLQGIVDRVEESDRRVASLQAGVQELRGRLAPDTDSGQAARQVLAGRADFLEELAGDAPPPEGLRDTAVAAGEAARSCVQRERAVAEDRAAAQRESARSADLRNRAERTRDDLRVAREELSGVELRRDDLARATRDEALVRERARSARDAVEASREHERARAAETGSAAAYERAEATRREAARAVEDLEARRFANAAATLAGELGPGLPCPVCGATEHPRPASTENGDDVSTGALDRARAARDAAQDAVDERHAELERARRATAEALARGADPDLEAVQDRARGARAAEERLDDALEALQVCEQQLGTARERLADLEAGATRLTAEAEEARTRSDALQERCDRESGDLAAQLRGFATAREFLDRAEELVRLVTDLDAGQHALDSARHHAAAHRDALDRALAESPFGGPKEVSAALMDPERASREQSWLEDRQRELSRVEAELSTEDMQRAARLTPEERAELTTEALATGAAELAASEQLRDHLTQQLGGLRALAAEIETSAREVPQREGAYERARDRAERLSGLADVATATSSENSLRMTLTSFVLAAKLEHVAAVASEHLSRMSSGRFTLVHTDQARGGGKAGLGLEIDDSWTGVRRGTETLSGGESFFTSLALALALADVVRAEAGGQDIDTLFVDEGFGSLDEQTLEQVLETLDGLRRDGRVIGVVSHVSEMKQRIATQLVVTKTPQGSHLSVTTGP